MNFTANKSLDSGQWIIAYQAEQRKRLKTSLIPAAIDHLWERVSHTESGRPTVPKNTPASTSAKYRRILDKELLVREKERERAI